MGKTGGPKDFGNTRRLGHDPRTGGPKESRGGGNNTKPITVLDWFQSPEHARKVIDKYNAKMAKLSAEGFDHAAYLKQRVKGGGRKGPPKGMPRGLAEAAINAETYLHEWNRKHGQ